MQRHPFYPYDHTRLPELIELDHYRIVHGLTWAALANAMRRQGVYVGPTTLCYLLKRGPLRARPTDKTLYKIRQFLLHVHYLDRRRETRAKKRRRAAQAVA